MQTPADLNHLSHAEKDAVIVALQEQVSRLQQMVLDLQARLNLNSRNSSKPPASDGLNKPAPKSLRVGGQKPSGGQKGHPGNTLRQVAEPDEVVTHGVPAQCPACEARLNMAYVGESRQVFDLPTLGFKVTEHRAMQALCSCGQVHTASFPPGVEATVQYGPVAQAAMVHLNQNHAVPLQRTAALMKQLFGLPVSQATVHKAALVAQEILQPTVQAIAQATMAAAVVHADESGVRVAKKRHWLHVLATDTLS